MRRRIVARLGLVAVAIVAVLIAVGPFAETDAGLARTLRICVDVAGTEVDLNSATARIDRLVRSSVASHPRFADVGFTPARTTVVAGCPGAPALLASGSAHPKNGGGQTRFGVTQTPSGFQVFVFVVPRSDVERMFGSLPFRTAGQETVCDNGSCGEVSTALYISPDLLTGPDNGSGGATIAGGLVQAIGLERGAPATQGQPGRQK